MKLPNKESIRVSPEGHGFEKSVSPEGHGLRFAMVPWEVGTDPRLKHLDVRVFFVLAGCRRAAVAKIGMRLIARHACTTTRYVVSSIKRLQSCGYLESQPVGNGSRAHYRLTSAKFSISGKDPIGVELSTVDVRTRGRGMIRPGELTPTIIRCPRCSKHCGGLLKVGWCRSCQWDDKVDKRIDAKLKTA